MIELRAILQKVAFIRHSLGDGGAVVLGVGSYAAYREHMAEAHPEHPLMTQAEFFRQRQQARYGGGQGRCC